MINLFRGVCCRPNCVLAVCWWQYQLWECVMHKIILSRCLIDKFPKSLSWMLEGLCGCPHRAHFFPLMLTLYTVEAMNLWTIPTTFQWSSSSLSLTPSLPLSLFLLSIFLQPDQSLCLCLLLINIFCPPFDILDKCILDKLDTRLV